MSKKSCRFSATAWQAGYWAAKGEENFSLLPCDCKTCSEAYEQGYAEAIRKLAADLAKIKKVQARQ